MDTDFLTKATSRLKKIHLEMRQAVRLYMLQQNDLTRVIRKSDADTIYALDCVCEEILLKACHEWGKNECFILIAEGLSTDQTVFPKGADAGDAAFILIVDPVDGTRGLMYEKRSAWILSAIAPNLESETTLAHIELAIQTEIPLSKQYLADMLYTIRGRGTKGERQNLFTNEILEFYPRPSGAKTLKHGFAMLSKFFPGRKQISAAIEEELLRRLDLLDQSDSPFVFDDQYISTGGQIYELTVGHDRFSGDFRAHLMQCRNLAGFPPTLAVHPYDLCTELIAREAGVIITNIRGYPLNYNLDTSSNVSWIGYANQHLQDQIEPHLQSVLKTFGIMDQYATD